MDLARCTRILVLEADEVLSPDLLCAISAAASRGRKHDVELLLNPATYRVPTRPDALALAKALLDDLMRGARVAPPDWPTFWSENEPAARSIVAQIEAASRMAGLTAITLTHAERILANRMAVGTTARIGNTAVATFDLDQPVTAHIAATDRLIGIVSRGGREVGRFECFADQAADADAVAAILADFLDAPTRPEADFGVAPIAESEAAPDIEHLTEREHTTAASPRDLPDGVPVLMYHRVTDTPIPALAQWAVSPADFAAQMQWLAANGFTALSLADFESVVWHCTPLPARPVLITFDDGYRDTRDSAAPVLRAHGLAATVFLPTSYVGKTAAWDKHFGPPAPLMGWDEIAELQASGITFAAHSRSHLPMTSLSNASVKNELSRPLAALQRYLGHSVTALAYPYGAYDEAVQRAVFSSGYKLAFTTESRRWRRGERVMAIPRLEVPGGLSLEGFAKLLTT